MAITERQNLILEEIIKDYIDLAQPISSQFLTEKHRFRISPATIRIEMQKLTEGGYLYQPHTSAGRIPTDKGYRFFVDELLGNECEDFKQCFEIDRDIRTITKFIAAESSSLALGYLTEDDILWKEGWREIFQEPEFIQAGYAIKFTQALDDFEKNVKDLMDDLNSEIRIYIGKENPFSKTNDFSIITAGIFTILGPKRMDYNKNINLINSVVKWMQKI